MKRPAKASIRVGASVTIRGIKGVWGVIDISESGALVKSRGKKRGVYKRVDMERLALERSPSLLKNVWNLIGGKQ